MDKTWRQRHKIAKQAWIEGEIGDRLRYRSSPTTLNMTNEIYMYLGLRKDF